VGLEHKKSQSTASTATAIAI